MNTNVYIYALIYFDTPLYVGATINIKKRLANHMNTTLKEYPNKSQVKINILETTVKSLAASVEKKWTFYYLDKGVKLLKVPKTYYPSDFFNNIHKEYPPLKIALLATAFKKSTQTIYRWISSKDDRLTSDRAKSALLKLKK